MTAEQSAEAGRAAPEPASPPRGLLGAPGWAGASAYGDPASPAADDRTTERRAPQQTQDAPMSAGTGSATSTPQAPQATEAPAAAPTAPSGDETGGSGARSSKLVDAAGVGGVTGGMVAAVNWMTTRRRRREERASSRAAAAAPREQGRPRDADTLPETATVPASPTPVGAGTDSAGPTSPSSTPAPAREQAAPADGDRTAEPRAGGRPEPAPDDRGDPADATPADSDTSSRAGSAGTAAAVVGGAAVAGGALAASRAGRGSEDAPAAEASTSDDASTTTTPAATTPAAAAPAADTTPRADTTTTEAPSDTAARSTTAPDTTAPDATPEATTVETPASREQAAAPEPEPSSGPTVPSAPAADPQQVEAQSAWSARAERKRRRRRVLLVMLVAVVAILLVWAIPWLVSTVASFFSGGEERTSILPPDGAAPAASAPPARPELPRGGTTFFPGYRVVAYYGTPDNPSMGILGDGPPEAMAQKLEEAAQAFATPGRVVQPTMELIVHVADGAPGEDGDYSHAIDEAKAWQYLAVARANRQLLVIDIQPGSSDFLTTTKPWERLLREPDVGLALDPEWRMPPGQVPGQQIGTVSSAEVNETAEWLAGIVREANLPQKLFVVHQFTPNMITEPERLVTPPELAVVQHVDGFGGPADKIAKYSQLARPGQLHPGFKLFYTQDTPVLSPAQTLGLNPSPDFVTYQ